MGQDNIKCGKCGILCGHDDQRGYWPGHDRAICSLCQAKLGLRFGAFVGTDGYQAGYGGVTVDWADVDRILSLFKQDNATRTYVYTVSMDDLYKAELGEL